VGRFATLVYGVLAPDGGFAYSSAGHNPPLLASRAGVRRLTAGGLLLGAFPDAAFEEETVRLEGGDAIVLFSDGVTEARSAQDDEFGEERLVSCVAAHAGDSAAGLAAAVLDQVREFSGDAPPADDVTVAVIRYRPRG
jgi:sigma-B regulation protein RsbU (phosphoserine phosphatase)